MSTPLTLATATPHPACAARAGDESFSLPDWLYRSEAFAEDLPGSAAPAVLSAPPQPPRRASRVSSGALYLATVALAVASSVPTALLLA